MKVIVCGAGQVGFGIASHLASEGNDVTVVDRAASLMQRISDTLDVRPVLGHGGLAAAGLLLEHAPHSPPLVQYTSDAQGCAPRYADYGAATAPAWRGPLEVWIDGQTASAAEAPQRALNPRQQRRPPAAHTPVC